MRVVERLRDGSRLYYDGPVLYTHIDALGNNLLSYISAMADILAGVQTVLLLGAAGGALATQLSRGGAAVTAVDNWAPAFELARRWFHLPDDVECIHADAVAFLRGTDRRWQGVAIDVFDGVEIPASFLASEIGGLLSRVAEPGGLIVWNVADVADSPAARAIYEALRLGGLEPAAVPVIDTDVGNTLVVGCAAQGAAIDGAGSGESPAS